jgi:diacylglycerol O-acyltransferase
MVRPITDTRSPIMRERGLVRHLELLEVPVRDLRAAARAVDGHLNDAYIAAIAGGLRRYHEAHGACVSQLRVTMPISIREDEHDVGGNHITLVRFDLPVGVADPAERMRAVRAICDRERHEPAIGRSELIAGMLNLLPVGVSGGMLRHVDLLASNVPGFDFGVYVAGARVEGFFPFGATLGSAANITLMSYRGSCCVGINTDTDAVPDPDVFAATLREGFDEVIAVAAS